MTTSAPRTHGRGRRFAAALLLSATSSLACSLATPTPTPGEPSPTPAPTAMTESTTPNLELDPLIDRALAEPEAIPEIAAQLRARHGKQALNHLIARHRAEVPSHARHGEADRNYRLLIDQVAQQRDAHFGGLYWQRDLDEARRIAAVEQKPILSLRILGDLTSEYSCANSRLFRTILYGDPALASWLDAHFVLHWSSERPVPRIAIDFGDGRTLARTITGNSAHFVLDAEGRTIDVIPGLLAPSNFRATLDESLALHAALAEAPRETWAQVLADSHERHFQAAVTRTHDELARMRGELPREAVARWLAQPPSSGEPVPAAQAVPIAIGKMKMEAPILGAADQLGGAARRVPASVGALDELERTIIGARLTGPLALHDNAWTIIVAERPLDGVVAPAHRSDALETLRATLLRSVQEDTAKNLLELRPRIHAELARRAVTGELDFASVDAWLYARVFETPADDPWLGLVDPTIYTGLVEGGLARVPAP